MKKITIELPPVLEAYVNEVAGTIHQSKEDCVLSLIQSHRGMSFSTPNEQTLEWLWSFQEVVSLRKGS